MCGARAQVDILKLLYDRMLALHLKHADTADEWRFPRPSFKARTASKPSCHVLGTCAHAELSSVAFIAPRPALSKASPSVSTGCVAA